MNFETKEIQFALEAVQKACSLTKQVQREMAMGEMKKSDKSPVTVGDFAGQAIIGKILSETFPEDVLVGEEGSEGLKADDGKSTLEKVTEYVRRVFQEATHEQICDWIDVGNGEPGEKFWTLDPIDGTKGFLRGDQYAVGLSLIENGHVELGVIGCPNLSREGDEDKQGPGVIVVAKRGHGVWMSALESEYSFEQIQVSHNSELQAMRVLRSVETKHTHVSRTAAFMDDLGVHVEPVYMDSQAKYVMLALGKGDCFFYLVPQDRPHYRMKIWDVAPGAIVIEEAGGKITDLEGKALDFTQGLTMANNPGLVMTNGILHEKVIEALNKVCEQR